ILVLIKRKKANSLIHDYQQCYYNKLVIIDLAIPTTKQKNLPYIYYRFYLNNEYYHRQKKTSEKQDEVQRRIEELGESHEKTLESIKVFHRLTSAAAPKSFL
ncbi:MAG: hypothetical protein WBP88_12575, partial [Nitrososphaeraceae archaeon]